jgi:signal transduction histidine kinase
MGLGISGMHYIGMSAMRLSPGAYCTGGVSLEGMGPAIILSILAISALIVTLLLLVYDNHLESRSRQEAQRLAQLNAQLEHGKNMLALATRAAGITCWEYTLATQAVALWTENELKSLLTAGIDCAQDLLRRILPDDHREATRLIKAALAAGDETCALRLRVPAGEEIIHLFAHARLIKNEQGQLTHLVGVIWDETAKVLSEEKRARLQEQLREVSRNAGMAQVATGVLHSVGNVLNSLSISAAVVHNGLKNSRIPNVERLAHLLIDQGASLGEYLATERGRAALPYLLQLSQHLVSDNARLQEESAAVLARVEHIGKIVAAQQTYATRGGSIEAVPLSELIESAISLRFSDSTSFKIVRDFAPIPPVLIDRHKLIQILGNLLGNAEHALKSAACTQPVLTVRVRALSQARFALDVEDTGVGIDAATLAKLFAFGFTTKADGHGFGLHTCAILAKELGGELTAYSEGLGRGARFSLILPLRLTQEEQGQIHVAA